MVIVEENKHGLVETGSGPIIGDVHDESAPTEEGRIGSEGLSFKREAIVI